MNNKFKSYLALLLVVILLIGCVGCSKENVSPTVTVTEPTTLPYEEVEGKYFVKDGKTDYVIVAPEGDTTCILNAVSEMESFFEEAIGADVLTFTDNEEIPAGKKIISLGDTKQAQSALGVTGESMEQESFRIVTKDDNVYVIGEGYGVLWGVYQLLNYMFNYEFYKADVYTLNTGVKERKFFDIDETQVPDIVYFPSLYNGLRGSGTSNTLRYRQRNEWELTVGKQWHNSFIVLDPNVYLADHPKWYNDSKNQLCYTAHGDEAELQIMIDTAVAYYVSEFEAAPTKTYAAFIMQDNGFWCNCDACAASKQKYGAQSTAQLIMAQRIQEGITKELSAKGDTRKIKVLTMVYNECEDVPAVYNETTEKYEFSDPTLKLDGVVPFWAAMSLKKHDKPWSDPSNAKAVQMLEQLSDLFSEFWVWDYAVNFHDYLAPFNSFTTMSEDFKFLSKYNIGYYLYQCDHDAGNSTGFGALKTYLTSKLRWNADLDISELTDNFFRAVYGPGGSAMKEIYDQYLTLATLNASGYTTANGEQQDAWDQSIYSASVLNEKYWPKGLLKDWLALLDESMASIEPLKTTDPEKYEIYAYNILIEGIFVRYIYAANYLTENNVENTKFKTELVNDVLSYFSRIGEGTSRPASGFASKIGLN